MVMCLLLVVWILTICISVFCVFMVLGISMFVNVMLCFM